MNNRYDIHINKKFEKSVRFVEAPKEGESVRVTLYPPFVPPEGVMPIEKRVYSISKKAFRDSLDHIVRNEKDEVLFNNGLVNFRATWGRSQKGPDFSIADLTDPQNQPRCVNVSHRGVEDFIRWVVDNFNDATTDDLLSKEAMNRGINLHSYYAMD